MTPSDFYVTLLRNPAMCWIVGGKTIERGAASTSQMSWVENRRLGTDNELDAFTDPPDAWIDQVCERKLPKVVMLDGDISISPMFGNQEDTASNEHTTAHWDSGVRRAE